MSYVIKRNGDFENFNRHKIQQSMINAGIDGRTARTIALEIPEKNMYSHEIRTLVIEKLMWKCDAAACGYKLTLRLRVSNNNSTKKGVAIIPSGIMEQLEIHEGDIIHLIKGYRMHSVNVKSNAEKGSREIHLHKDDLKMIGAVEGERIAIHRNIRL